MPINSTNAFADVDIQPVEVAGKQVDKIAVRVKDDAGEYQVAGVLNKDYNLIKNSRCHEVALDVFSRSPYKWDELKQNWDGKHYLHYFISEPITELKSPSGFSSHALSLGALLRNSYDGTGAFAFEMYIANLHCTNQYIMRNRMGFFHVRHVGDTEFDIEDGIQNIGIGAQNLISIAPKIEQLRGLPLQVADILDARKETKIPTSKWGEVILQLALEEATKFGLFQALTNIASHKLSGLSALDVGSSITSHFIKD